MTVVASLILTGIDLAVEVYQRRKGRPSNPTHRTMSAKATLEEFQDLLRTVIDEGRDVTPEEIEFWRQRIQRDRETLRTIAAKNDGGDPDDEWR